MRVILYAEGAGETRGELGWPPAPLELLTEAHLGPGHVLVRRALASAREQPAASISFLAPLRVRARVPRGSDLLDGGALRTLVAFATVEPPRPHPDLVVVLVDADGDEAGRRKRVQPIHGVAMIVGVAVEEFESWLVSDHAAAQRILGTSIAAPPAPHNLRPREAKRLLDEWLGGAPPAEGAARRRALADAVDLDTVGQRSPSFARFLKDVRAAPLT